MADRSAITRSKTAEVCLDSSLLFQDTNNNNLPNVSSVTTNTSDAGGNSNISTGAAGRKKDHRQEGKPKSVLNRVKMMKFVASLLIICSISSAQKAFPNLDVLRSKTVPLHVQAQAVRELIQRFVGSSQASRFKVIIKPTTFLLDTYNITCDVNSCTIKASDGVTAARGFGYILTEVFGGHISWAGDNIVVPDKFPVTHVIDSSPFAYRYYQNVCTPSYSFVWWNWTRWEREIDWMAINGYNLPLAFNAQEAIWQKVYLKMGFKQEDLDKHFSGPAFLAWERMGNMHGWGGPTPQSWHANQLALQHKILKRMRKFAMAPVLPAFAGHVPETITKLFPNASVTRLGDWGHFGPDYCCTYLLDPVDPLFKTIGKAFIEAQIEEYNGTDHIYSADTFNEMTPKSHDPDYLSNASRGVYDAIAAADPVGTWLMQGWLFQNHAFWGPKEIKAYLHGVPMGRLIVLDLFAEAAPIYSMTESFYGLPFIWCMLHNFGGNTGMYGKLKSVNEGPFFALNFPNSTIVGVGITPEGIEQNDVVYNFFNSLIFRNSSRDVKKWLVTYAKNRYSGTSDDIKAAWEVLANGVYNCPDSLHHHNHAVIVRRPQQKMNLSFWYDWTKLGDVWGKMLSASKALGKSSLYRYDLVDFTRQALQDLSYHVYKNLTKAFELKDQDKTRKYSSDLLTIIKDMDNITSSHDRWLLGTWLEAARALGTSNNESNLYEFNARNQLTLWGPLGEILDYANKQWGGLLRSYYLERWTLFTSYLIDCLQKKQKYDQDTFNKMSLQAGQNWTMSRDKYPTTAMGDTVAISEALYQKYKPIILNSAGYDPLYQLASGKDAIAEKYGEYDIAV